MSAADRRHEVVDATLEALRHTVGRDEHLPIFTPSSPACVGPVTFAEIAEALASASGQVEPAGFASCVADFSAMRRAVGSRTQRQTT